MKSNFFIKVGLALLLILGSNEMAFAQKGKKSKKKKKSKQTQISSEDKLKAEDLFIEAQTAKMLDKTEKAKTLFQECVDIDPNNDAAFYELGQIFYDEKRGEEAFYYAETASKLAPENKWYLRFLADVLAANGNYSESAKTYKTLTQKFPNNPEFLFDQAQMLKISGDYKAAIEAYDKIEQLIGVEETIILEKQRLYIKDSQVDKAASELEKLIKEHPTQGRYYTLLADLYIANGKEEKANKVYEKLLKIDPDNIYGKLAMAEQYEKQGDTEKFMETIKSVFANPKIDATIKADILMTKFGGFSEGSEEEMSNISELSTVLVEAHPEDARVQAIKGDVLNFSGKKEEALVHYKKSVAIDGNIFMVWQNIFFIESELNKMQDLADDSQSAIELFPNQALPYYFNGIAQNRLKKHEKAVKSLKRSAMIGADNKPLLGEVYSQLGEAYNSLKKYEKSDDSFDKSLEIDSENAYTLNNYSYYLSLRNEKLEKAAKMSKKSNDLVPNSSSFLDTYAWILYQKGEYEEAKKYQQQAMDNGGNERPVVVEHFGDILFQLGEVEKAVEMWKKAKELGGDANILDKKINEKKL